MNNTFYVVFDCWDCALIMTKTKEKAEEYIKYRETEYNDFECRIETAEFDENGEIILSDPEHF